MPQRYKKTHVRGRSVSQHRAVMERVLGRPLLPSEHVHHKNGDGRDNRPENLELLSAQAHAQLHKQKHPRVKVCEACGKSYEPAPTKRERSKTCSRECWRAWMSRFAAERAQRPEYIEKLRVAGLRDESVERARTLRQFRADVRAGVSR